MKTASLAQAPAHDSKGGGGSRKPFFSGVAQARANEAVQARMQLGRPGDRFEVEADKVADRVVDGKAARPGQPSLAAGITPLAQREPAPAGAEVEDEVQAKAEAEEEEVQAKAAPEEEEVQAQAAPEEEEAQAQADAPPEEEVQAKADDEKEDVQARPADKEEELQAKPSDEEKEELQAKPSDPPAPTTRGEEEEVQAKAGDPAAGNEEELQARPREEGRTSSEPSIEEEVQPRAGKGGPLPVSEEVARQVRAARGLGNAMPEPVRDKMRAAFGADVSGVRIHTDAAAVLLTKSLNAQAFTVGNDIFFGEGEFAPGSRDGQHLLAHELAHTVQQGAVAADSQSDVDVIRLAPETEEGMIRPELAEAIRLARGEIGKVNAKASGGDGKRQGWERLREYFTTAFGGPVVNEQVIDRITMLEATGPDGTKVRKDALPSWCGIFAWWALKKAGIAIPDWKLGKPGLEAMKPRAKGELPRAGDVAIDVLPNNHFGMITELETAGGKLTRVGTINGNTAGEDNLGGQVQEKWDAPARWDHFLDPVGKMNLPPAPLVRPPEKGEPAEAAGAEAEAEKEKAGPSPAAEAAEATEAALDELDQDVPLPELEAMTDPLPEPDLTLPPRGEGGPAEEVAVVEQVDLSGSSDQATTAFIDAGPSAMAVSQPGFGQAVDSKMKGEQQEIVDNPPVLEAKTSGAVDVPLKSPDELPVPADTSIAPEAGQGGGDLDTVSSPDPGAFRGNAERDKQLEQEESGGFFDAFMNFIKGFIKGVPTKDGSIDTSAGERPSVDMSADADPTNMATDREKGTADLRAQRDAQVESFKNNPGQANIQPKKIDESFSAPVAAEPTAEIEPQDDQAVRDYAEAPLPADVRAKADAKIAEQMAPELAEQRTQTTDAAGSRDTQKKTEIETAEKEAAKINAGADTEQRNIVVDNRGKVAKLQGEGIGGAYDQVNAFAKDAGAEQGKNRKEIGDHVKTEQGKATKTLEDGEKEAEKEKVDGEKKAEDKKKELEKAEEDDGWWGWVKDKIKKAVKVITDAIDAVFTAVRKAVKDIIDKVKNLAIDLINKARNWVVDKINKFRDWAKDQVNKYLKDSFPGLAKRINAGIDAVADTAIAGVNAVADAAIAGINKLANALAAALDKILSTFQTALKTAVRVVGAVMQGDFAEALKAAIEGACEIAGIDPKPVFEFLDRAGKAIMSILKAPVKFIKSLFGAVGDGLSNFFKNIKTHLIEGVIGWLTGALSEVNLTGPFEFSAKGILRIVLEILGLTYGNIKARVIKKLPAAAGIFDKVEAGFDLLKRLVTEGPGALWEEIKGRVSDIKETVMGAIRSWLITTVIKEGIIWLLSLTNPASAIVKAVKLLFDLVMFLVERYQQIKDFILTVYEAVAAIAAGNFTKVVKAVEDALARVLPVLISLLASLIGLGGIAKQVKKVIEAITKPINKAIDWVIDRIIKFAKKLLGKAKAGAKKAKEKAKETLEKIATWWKERRKFKAKNGSEHSIYYKGEAKKAELMVASTPEPIETFLNKKATSPDSAPDQKQVATSALAQYKLVLESEAEIERLRAEREKVTTAEKEKYRAATSAVNSEITKFRNRLFDLSQILKGATFGDEDDALVQTAVSHDAGGDKSTRALPLTFLSGNTKGSRPSEDPDGWELAEQLDRKPDGTSRSMWVRGHLLNDNLHGPGTAKNLVPVTQTMNRRMEAEVEKPAKQAIKERGKLFFYETVVSFWKSEPKPVNVFPQKIVVTWGTAKRTKADPKKFERDVANTPVPITMDKPPPADPAKFVPTINGGSPLLLFNAIKKHGEVTTYFISEILLPEVTKAEGQYKSKDDMQTRLMKGLDGAQAATRRTYVNATYQAITAGDVEV